MSPSAHCFRCGKKIEGSVHEIKVHIANCQGKTEAPAPAKRSKYGNVKTVYDGVRYDSKAEAWYAYELDQEPDLDYWLRQVPFQLPGGVVYRVDFITVERTPPTPDYMTIRYYDVKGVMTPMSQLKIKQVHALYPVTIQIIPAKDILARHKGESLPERRTPCSEASVTPPTPT